MRSRRGGHVKGFCSLRHVRIWQRWEQNWRSPRPALRRNHRPHCGAGHRAHVILPAISSARRCQRASISRKGR